MKTDSLGQELRESGADAKAAQEPVIGTEDEFWAAFDRTNIQGEMQVNPNLANGITTAEACQQLGLHPLLAGNFEPDVRPFEWPKRTTSPQRPRAIQPNLFEGGDND